MPSSHVLGMTIVADLKKTLWSEDSYRACELSVRSFWNAIVDIDHEMMDHWNCEIPQKPQQAAQVVSTETFWGQCGSDVLVRENWLKGIQEVIWKIIKSIMG